jgi:hypothetical protein
LKEQRRILLGAPVELVDDIPAGRVSAGGSSAMTAEMDHRGLELAKLAKQVERLCGPACDELEAVAVAASLELELHVSGFAIECESLGPEWIRGQEQDRVLLHGVPWRGDRARPIEEPECPGNIASADGRHRRSHCSEAGVTTMRGETLAGGEVPDLERPIEGA